MEAQALGDMPTCSADVGLWAVRIIVTCPRLLPPMAALAWPASHRLSKASESTLAHGPFSPSEAMRSPWPISQLDTRRPRRLGHWLSRWGRWDLSQSSLPAASPTR